MTTTTPNDVIQKRQQAINDCIAEYNLPINDAIDEELLRYSNTPDISSKKLALLILTYKREALTTELNQVSDQAAAQVRDLRNDGFMFQEGSPNRFIYKNEKRKLCRKIVGFGKPKEEIKQHAKSVLQKSIAACVSAIEIYNKPDFQYREETFSILLVNAWELLLKAKILFDNNDNFSSILEKDNQGNTKKGKSGNELTFPINYCLKILFEQSKLSHNTKINLELLIEVRDNAIHYINKTIDFTKKVQEIGLASIKNYVTAIDDWFEKDLSEYNFFLMPMSFFHSLEPSSFSVKSKNKELNNILSYFKTMEASSENDADDKYHITLQLKTKFVKVLDDDVLKVGYTNDEGAPKIKVEEDNLFISRFILTHKELCQKLKEKYVDFKENKYFQDTKKLIHNQFEGHLCKRRYMNPKTLQGSSQWFYNTEIINEFGKYYIKKKV